MTTTLTARHDLDDLTRRARRRVGLKIGFYMHLLVYLLVNGGLFLLQGARGEATWLHLPLLGWGLGLAIHGIVCLLNLQGEGLRERLLADEIERLKGRR